jgi:hypothetical protein
LARISFSNIATPKTEAQRHREVMLLFVPLPARKQPLAGASEKLPAAFGAGDAN